MSACLPGGRATGRLGARGLRCDRRAAYHTCNYNGVISDRAVRTIRAQGARIAGYGTCARRPRGARADITTLAVDADRQRGQLVAARRRRRRRRHPPRRRPRAARRVPRARRLRHRRRQGHRRPPACPARWVIHTVGPGVARRRPPARPELLASCYRRIARGGRRARRPRRSPSPPSPPASTATRRTRPPRSPSPPCGRRADVGRRGRAAGRLRRRRPATATSVAAAEALTVDAAARRRAAAASAAGGAAR